MSCRKVVATFSVSPSRKGHSLLLSTEGDTLQTWQPDDIVYWNTGNTSNTSNTRLHTGVVSDTRNAKGEPFVVHNGSVCVEDDALTRWRIIGHFPLATIRN